MFLYYVIMCKYFMHYFINVHIIAVSIFWGYMPTLDRKTTDMNRVALNLGSFPDLGLISERLALWWEKYYLSFPGIPSLGLKLKSQ